MLAGYLGDDGFRKGMDLYFARHDGQAVTCDDFVTALADATGTDLMAFAGWQSGWHTSFDGDAASEGGRRRLDVGILSGHSETAAKTPRQPLPVPVRLGLVGGDGQPVPFRLTADGVTANEQVVLLNTARMVQPLYTGGIGDVVPSLLRNFLHRCYCSMIWIALSGVILLRMMRICLTDGIWPRHYSQRLLWQ